MVGLRGDGGEWFVCGRAASGTTSPGGALFLKTFRRRLIVSTDLYFHFFVVQYQRQNSLSFLVNVNSAQLNDACDQGRTVETCCAKNKILSQSFVCCLSKRGSGKTKYQDDLKSSAFSHCKYVFCQYFRFSERIISNYIISNVTLNCQVTIIVTTSGFQLSKMLSMSQRCLEWLCSVFLYVPK